MKTAVSGITATSISSLSGLTVDGLIGMDILKQFDILFNEMKLLFLILLFLRMQIRTIKLSIIETVMGIPIISCWCIDWSDGRFSSLNM